MSNWIWYKDCPSCKGEGHYRVPSYRNSRIEYEDQQCYRCKDRAQNGGKVEKPKEKEVPVVAKPVIDLTVDDLKALRFTVQYRFQELENLFSKHYAEESKTYQYYKGLFDKLTDIIQERGESK